MPDRQVIVTVGGGTQAIDVYLSKLHQKLWNTQLMTDVTFPSKIDSSIWLAGVIFIKESLYVIQTMYLPTTFKGCTG